MKKFDVQIDRIFKDPQKGLVREFLDEVKAWSVDDVLNKHEVKRALGRVYGRNLRIVVCSLDGGECVNFEVERKKKNSEVCIKKCVVWKTRSGNVVCNRNILMN